MRKCPKEYFWFVLVWIVLPNSCNSSVVTGNRFSPTSADSEFRERQYVEHKIIDWHLWILCRLFSYLQMHVSCLLRWWIDGLNQKHQKHKMIYINHCFFNFSLIFSFRFHTRVCDWITLLFFGIFFFSHFRQLSPSNIDPHPTSGCTRKQIRRPHISTFNLLLYTQMRADAVIVINRPFLSFQFYFNSFIYFIFISLLFSTLIDNWYFCCFRFVF